MVATKTKAGTVIGAQMERGARRVVRLARGADLKLVGGFPQGFDGHLIPLKPLTRVERLVRWLRRSP